MALPSSRSRLEVYQVALNLSFALEAIARSLPDWRGDIRDQLLRASTSIPLNIAEGTGEYSPGDKARFYRMARRSAVECGAIIDILALNEPSALSRNDPRDDLARVEAMLTALVLSVERRKK